MTTPMWKAIQSEFSSHGLQSVFLRVLGWSRPNSTSSHSTVIGHVTWNWEVLATLKGAAVVVIQDQRLASPEEHRKLSKAIGQIYPEHILLFDGPQRDIWYWPRQLSSGGKTLESIPVRKRLLPDFLAQRLGGLHFSDRQLETLTPAAVRDRLRGNVETTKITKDFYSRFKSEHEALAKRISGVSPDEAYGYSTLLLNRLMFLWFLQKKEFLNNDPRYLQTCFAKLKELSDKTTFYSFYRDYLCELFFLHLNERRAADGQPEIAEIIGDVPFINGGIFGASELEQSKQIDIPDEAFESVFLFFDSFTWHLDTRPTGDPREINPEVIGYIFEQYINFTADGKKADGAYYTPSDVTSYMSGASVSSLVAERLIQAGFTWTPQLMAQPTRYVQEAMTHGSSQVKSHVIEWQKVPSEIEDCWLGNPNSWDALDEAGGNPELQLPGETWVETMHRRDRLRCELERLSANPEVSPQEAITMNLQIDSLILDLFAELDSEIEAKKVFEVLKGISIIDPTCGSGAFLFAAMHCLETFYLSLVERFPGLLNDDEEVTQGNNRFRVRKLVAMKNLYGVDLMEDAIETAKLRLFLSLAACLESREEFEPLPDLDFNIRCGNLVVGFKDSSEIEPHLYDFIDGAAANLIMSEVSNFEAKLESFISTQASGSDPRLKSELVSLNQTIRESANDAYFRFHESGSGLDFDAWVKTKKPFHWFAEFPSIMKEGGFDVVVGNPPYIGRRSSNFPKSDMRRFRTQSAPDFYATCLERAMSLLKVNGQLAFIVMLSMSFGKDFEVIRTLVSDEKRSEHWSTFGLWPRGLFEGAGVRNTILLLGPKSKDPSVFSTRLHIFNEEQRSWMFDCIEYTRSSRSRGSASLSGGLLQEFVEEVSATASTPRRAGSAHIYLKSVGNYWFPALPGHPPTLDSSGAVVASKDSEVDPVALWDSETPAQTFALGVSKLAYLWWHASGDNFHATKSTFEKLRQWFAAKATHWPNELQSIEEEIWSAWPDFGIRNLYNGKYSYNLAVPKLRPYTDRWDELVCSHLDPSGALWRALNTWYRQVMRSDDGKRERAQIPRKECLQVFGFPND